MGALMCFVLSPFFSLCGRITTVLALFFFVRCDFSGQLALLTPAEHHAHAREITTFCPTQQLQLVLFRSLTCWVPCVQGRGGSWVPDPLQHRLQGVLGDVSGRVPLRAALSQRTGQGRGGCVQHLLCSFGAPLLPVAPDLFTDCSSAAPLWRAQASAALAIAMRITIPLCKAPSANLCCVWLSRKQGGT
jgi:hypothetical protein